MLHGSISFLLKDANRGFQLTNIAQARTSFSGHKSLLAGIERLRAQLISVVRKRLKMNITYFFKYLQGKRTAWSHYERLAKVLCPEKAVV